MRIDAHIRISSIHALLREYAHYLHHSAFAATAWPSLVTIRPQRDPGISRDPGIDLESRSRDFGKSNPGIFRDLSYQTKQ